MNYYGKEKGNEFQGFHAKSKAGIQTGNGLGYRLLGRLCWSRNMVYRVCVAGLIRKIKKFISAVLLVCLCILLPGCSSIIQPTRNGLVEMNSLSEGAYQLKISIDYADKDLVMLYDTTASVSGDDAIWEGEAIAYFLQTYFSQQCETLCDGDQSCKEWRGNWVAKDMVSPIVQLHAWQTAIQNGHGIYHKTRVPLCSYHEELQHEQGDVYEIVLHDVSLQWNALCDVDLDRVFGGNEKLYAVQQADVSLLYGTDDWLLKAVIISAESDQFWLSALITVTSVEDGCEVDLSEFEFSEGILTEEWSYLGYRNE